jgi:hypothetical protein
MRDQNDQAAKETKREGKLIDEEAAQLTREQARRQLDVAREQAIQKEQEAKEAKRKEKLIKEEAAQLTRGRKLRN